MARMALVTSAPVKFEIAKLVHHLEAHVLTLPIETQSPAFGGWSVLSSDGSYTDGWHKDISFTLKTAKRSHEF